MWESSNFLILLKMTFYATLISMVDHLWPIYSELQLMQIHEFAQILQNPYRKVQIREFPTAVTQNISDLKCRPWRLNLPIMLFLEILGSFMILWSIWWNFFF